MFSVRFSYLIFYALYWTPGYEGMEAVKDGKIKDQNSCKIQSE